MYRQTRDDIKILKWPHSNYNTETSSSKENEIGSEWILPGQIFSYSFKKWANLYL